MADRHGSEGGSSAADGFAAEAPEVPTPATAEEASGSDDRTIPAEPAGDQVGESVGESEQPPQESDEQAESRPRSALGWVLLPFAAVWRFLFPKKPRPFIVELPFLIVFAL